VIGKDNKCFTGISVKQYTVRTKHENMIKDEFFLLL